MRCPACGAFYKERSVRCPECGAKQNENSIELEQELQLEPIGMGETRSPDTPQKRSTGARNPSLIEFPGVHRTNIPEWRKELGERVREVQERRAREAILDAEGVQPLFCELDTQAAPVLELLPQAELPPVNPIVIAALRRIERAHSQPANAVATAIAYEEQPETEPDMTPIEEAPAIAKPERIHNLAVVPTPLAFADTPSEPKRPKRLIDDLNDPALNYLDSIPTHVTLETREYYSAPLYLRVLGAIVDLLVVSLLSSPVVALTELTNLTWQNPRVIAFAAGTFMVVGFLYLTISIAFTGRTLGLKLLSLRVVDARTGLIPTGSQCAGRALLYMLSLLSAGLVFLYSLIDSEKHCAHDRFSRTAVIRV